MADLPIKPIVDQLKKELVYGVQIKDYEIGGMKADFSAAIAMASLQQSEAIEALLPALNKTIDARQVKVNDLGEALATLTEALASMDPKSQSPSRVSHVETTKIANLKAILLRYVLPEIETDENGQIIYSEAYRFQNDVQKALDTESNDLQQNMTLLQSLVQKRDNSFEVAHKVLSKANRTASDTITAIGY
ncbi:MAG: hypothetical protein MJ109_02180 [Kiritimatiellae bacterium]|nr:hypothetical protein [Kiritimatiellia bacterium]